MAQVHIATQVVEYLHTDANGSVVATTDSAGELIGTVEYSPYGEPTSEPLSAFGYAGEWTDDVTGHVYLRARWLAVETGTFLSEDPLVQITMNAYGYTEGNPLSQIDPLGLFTLTPELTIEILSNVSTATGVLATISATISVFVPVTAPLTAPLAAASATVSLSTGVIATAGSCAIGSKEQCITGAISTSISAIPFVGSVSKHVKKLEYDAMKITPKKTLSMSRKTMTK